MDFLEISRLDNVKLDIGCGGNKQEGFIGMDKRPLEGVDIVHDLENFPWPLQSNKCIVAVAAHFVEHLKPWLMLDFMNEVWRVMKPGGTFAIAVPYAGSRGFWQDPTHINGCNEVTWQYFDPDYPLYTIYKPKPWKIRKGFPVYQVQGNMEVILEKISENLGKAKEEVGRTLGVSVADGIDTDERIGG
jgi:SAM-dependent methyltransferase